MNQSDYHRQCRPWRPVLSGKDRQRNSASSRRYVASIACRGDITWFRNTFWQLGPIRAVSEAGKPAFLVAKKSAPAGIWNLWIVDALHANALCTRVCWKRRRAGRNDDETSPRPGSLAWTAGRSRPVYGYPYWILTRKRSACSVHPPDQSSQSEEKTNNEPAFLWMESLYLRALREKQPINTDIVQLILAPRYGIPYWICFSAEVIDCFHALRIKFHDSW
jgi:hypothetical protein